MDWEQDHVYKALLFMLLKVLKTFIYYESTFFFIFFLIFVFFKFIFFMCFLVIFLDQGNSTLHVLLRRNEQMVQKQQQCHAIFQNFITNEEWLQNIIKKVFQIITLQANQLQEGTYLFLQNPTLT
jgi:cell division protein YceG involved in septum cleavage